MLFIFFILILISIIYLAGPGWHLFNTPQVHAVSLPKDLDEFVRLKESKVPHIKDDNQSFLKWVDSSKAPTPFSLIYLHGFSASPKEISPVVEKAASELKANAYLPRFSAHGVEDDLMEQLTFQQFFQDAEEAYTVGTALGRRPILIGTSTGATLALWLASRHTDIAGIILISPNLGIKNWKGFLAAGPLGYWVARLLVGPYRDRTFKYTKQEQYWNTRYSINGVRAMTDVVNEVKTLDFKSIKTPCLVLWTPEDQVVDIQHAISKLQKLGSPQKVFEKFENANHVLAGAITGAENVPLAVDKITQFIRKL